MLDGSLSKKGLYGDTSQRVYRAGNMHMEVILKHLGDHLLVRLPTVKGCLVRLRVISYSAGFSLTMADIDDGEALGIMEGMAFLQTLLSGGLTPLPFNPRLPGDVVILRYVFDGEFTQEELKSTQIAPLVPLASHHTFAILRVGGDSIMKAHMQIRQMGWCMPLLPTPLPWPLPTQFAQTSLHLRLCVRLPIQKQHSFFDRIMQYLINFFV
jgi:hypothetical protein